MWSKTAQSESLLNYWQSLGPWGGVTIRGAFVDDRGRERVGCVRSGASLAGLSCRPFRRRGRGRYLGRPRGLWAGGRGRRPPSLTVLVMFGPTRLVGGRKWSKAAQSEPLLGYWQSLGWWEGVTMRGPFAHDRGRERMGCVRSRASLPGLSCRPFRRRGCGRCLGRPRGQWVGGRRRRPPYLPFLVIFCPQCFVGGRMWSKTAQSEYLLN